MNWRTFIAVVLIAVLLVSASGAARLCVEADGSKQIEFVAALCCDDPAPSSPTGTEPGFAPLSPCSGCDDQPLDDARWSRSSTSQDVLSFALLPSSITFVVIARDSRQVERADSVAAGPPAPRAARPSILRC